MHHLQVLPLTDSLWTVWAPDFHEHITKLIVADLQ